MTVEQWHVTWSSVGRLPIVADEDGRRSLARALVQRCGASLVLFAIVDDHVHVWLYGAPAELGRLVRAVTLLLRARAAVPIEPAHVEYVRRRSHAEALVGYLLTQTLHHGISGHPAVASGMCAADLLGARDLG